MKKREQNENSLKNLKMFSDEYQPSGERKSLGKQEAKEKRLARQMMLDYIFNKLVEKDLIDSTVDIAEFKLLEKGDTKDIIELLKLIKPNEKQDINLSGEVQKVFINKDDEKRVNKHIEDIINS